MRKLASFRLLLPSSRRDSASNDASLRRPLAWIIGYVFVWLLVSWFVVGASAQEAKDPRRDLPIGILASLVVCTVLYILVALVLTGVVPYKELGVPDPIAVPDPLFHRREMTIMGSRNAQPGDFRRIIDLIRAGKIDTRPWISHRIGFEEVPARFDDLTRPETGVIKAMIDLESIN